MIQFSPACFYHTVIIKATYYTKAYVVLHYIMYTGLALKEIISSYAPDSRI